MSAQRKDIRTSRYYLLHNHTELSPKLCMKVEWYLHQKIFTYLSWLKLAIYKSTFVSGRD